MRKLRAAEAARSWTAPPPAWDHPNARLASFGIGGWFWSESMAAIVGMRVEWGPRVGCRWASHGKPLFVRLVARQIAYAFSGFHKLMEKPGWVTAKSFTNLNKFNDVQASFGAFVFWYEGLRPV
jgi:hypothetical protein